MMPFAAPRGGSSPFADSFTRADQALEASSNWQLLRGPGSGLAIRSGQIAATTSPDSVYAGGLPRSSGSFTSQMRSFSPSGGNCPALAAYIVDGDNYVTYRILNNASMVLRYYVGGSFGEDGVGAGFSPAQGKILRVDVRTDSKTFAVYYDDALVRTDPFPAGLPATGRRTGLAGVVNATGAFVDDFITDNL